MKKIFTVRVQREKCKACMLCADVCPSGLFRVSPGFNEMGYHYVEPVDGRGECSGCKKCVAVCPDVAIEIYVSPGTARAKKKK